MGELAERLKKLDEGEEETLSQRLRRLDDPQLEVDDPGGYSVMEDVGPGRVAADAARGVARGLTRSVLFGGDMVTMATGAQPTSERVFDAAKDAGVDLREGQNTMPGRASELMTEVATLGRGKAARRIGEGIASTVAAEGTRAMGGGEVAQSVAAMSPAVLGLAAGSVTRRIARGQARKEYLNAIRSYEAQGIAPTLGMVTQNKVLSGLEAGIKAVPGGAGVMHRKAVEINGAANKRLKQILAQTGADLEDDVVGARIGSILERRAGEITRKGEGLYNKVDAMLGDTSQFYVRTNKLSQLLGQYKPGEISKLIKAISPGDLKLQNIATEYFDLARTGGRRLTYAEVDEIRRAIGRQITNADEVSKQIPGELKHLYSVISEVQEDALKGLRNKKPLRAYQEAKDFWVKSREEIDTFINPILKKELGTDIYRAAIGRSILNPEKLDNIMRAATKDEADHIAKNFLANLGKVDMANGEVVERAWDIQKFYRNWDKISSKKKGILFRGNPQLRKNMDEFVAVMQDISENADYLANPSGTAGRGLMGNAIFVSLGAISGAAVGASQGDLEGGAFGGAAAMLTAMAGGAYGGRVVAKLLTNDKWVRWAAKSGKVTAARQIPMYMARLSTIINSENDPEMVSALGEFAEAMEQTFASAQSKPASE